MFSPPAFPQREFVRVLNQKKPIVFKKQVPKSEIEVVGSRYILYFLYIFLKLCQKSVS